MSRIEFGGHEGPIPDIALPDPNLSSDLPIQSLELVDGVPFEKDMWVALGYTHYEVWCIGGVGGRGAHPSSPIFPQIITTEAMPQDVWDAYMAANAAYDAQSIPPINFDEVSYRFIYTEPGNPNFPPGGVPGNDYGWPHSHRQWIEHYNPGHLGSVSTYLDPIMNPSPGMGGAGGGGGLHVVSGALADLPDSVPVAVGEAGVEPPPGQDQVNGPLDIWPAFWQGETWSQRYVGAADPTYYPPEPGGDGGASSFGDICMASGGKGGHPLVKWVGGLLVYDGIGGDGGVGGRTEAGGGALGAVTGNGKDGSWDGTIGQGGGGGRYGLPRIDYRAPGVSGG